MNKQSIKWSKEYLEDIGEEDENGFCDYTYRYIIYCFYLPNKAVIKIRRYTDTIDECALYFYGIDKQWKKQASEEVLNYLPSIINFMTVTQGVKQFKYFNGAYELLDLKKGKDNPTKFSFLEIPPEKQMF